jgi:hypothetical protein
MLLTLGALPCLPEELGHLDMVQPREAPQGEVGGEIGPAAPVLAAPTPAPVLPSVPAPPAAAAPARRPATPVPAAVETTVFRVAYGVLGELGEVKISYGFPGDAIHATGFGAGSLFGLGKIEKRVEAELEPGALVSRRWVATRVQSGKTITDTVEQPKPGDVAVVRTRSDRPDEGHRFTRQGPVLDPLAFLWRLRSQPPQQPAMYEVLDGRALWQISVAPTRTKAASSTRNVLIIAGKAEPIFWDGKPDDDRTARAFTLYLEGDAQHTPLRLVMPMAVGEVRVELTSVIHRKAPAPGAQAAAPAQAIPGGLRAALVKNVGR